jgi:DNA-binding MarR family transcriptional regulator
MCGTIILKGGIVMEDQKQLRESLRKLERVLGLLERTQASCCGTNLTQCHALVEIGRKGQLSVNGLADILQLDKSTTSRVVQFLVTQNWVQRNEAAEDRRIQEVSLTPEGIIQFRSIEASMDSFYRQVFEHLGASSGEQVVESVARLVDAIEKVKFEAPSACY